MRTTANFPIFLLFLTALTSTNDSQLEAINCKQFSTLQLFPHCHIFMNTEENSQQTKTLEI
ncbi:CLUMA_CG003113, isoform A [Clunio marinus]|uniref:CLUMA_CG003113, isoform A n=1 Tax=Clunio marinus TaxID=568069 RepID=A0A1J1HN25_9DIPT|nr:CLUMA_CG003113, isoform A [Clunio marinus]